MLKLIFIYIINMRIMLHILFHININIVYIWVKHVLN